jgi:hypothetical protein
MKHMTGFLDTQTRVNQIETIYIADFNRAADGPGAVYWTTTDSHAPIQIASSFLVQPEAASLPTTDVAAFIQSVYTNLFNRTADATGLSYWQGQIASGAVSLGAATYAIANGAQAADAAVLGFKIQAAIFFTQQTLAANKGATLPLDPTFLTNAHNAVANVVDAGSEQASQDATHQYVPNNPGGPDHLAVALVGQAATPEAHHG